MSESMEEMIPLPIKIQPGCVACVRVYGISKTGRKFGLDIPFPEEGPMDWRMKQFRRRMEKVVDVFCEKLPEWIGEE